MQPRGTTIATGDEDERNAGGAATGRGQVAAMKFTYPGGSRPLEGYTIKRGIGRGGFGEVYYATSDAGKDVALKLIRRNLDVELRGVRQCLNLKHPHLLSLYDIRQDDLGDTWVVMEYVKGEGLEQFLEDRPDGLSSDEVLQWFQGIASGVAYLHDRGIVHRDLKPGNIFRDEGVVKIGDYGLSKFISASRRSGQTESVGTVHYMAPEVANGRYGKEIDVYALGILLYEILTGHVPFEGESVGEILMKHLTAAPDLSELEEPFRSVVARALDKDPSRRYQSAVEMMAALPAVSTPSYEPDRVASPTPAAAPPPPPLPVAAVATRARDEEPILKAVREALDGVRGGWDNANLGPMQRTAILFLLFVAGVSTFGVWGPMLLTAVICYGVYRVVRAIAFTMMDTSAPHAERHQASPPPRENAAPDRAADEASSRWRFRRSGRVHGRRGRHARNRPPFCPQLPDKSMREHLMELTGSLLLATLVAVVVSLVIMVAGVMFVFPELVIRPEQFAWVSLVSTFGAWAVLIVSKFWERGEGEPMLRRFIMLLLGLGVGAVAFGAGELLLVELPYANSDLFPEAPRVKSDGYNLYLPDGSPTILGFLPYFAMIFVLVRWWSLADPLRTSRFKVWAVLMCAFWAWLPSMWWFFPQPWGIVVVVTTATAVQLASPWVDRDRVRESTA